MAEVPPPNDRGENENAPSKRDTNSASLTEQAVVAAAVPLNAPLEADGNIQPQPMRSTKNYIVQRLKDNQKVVAGLLVGLVALVSLFLGLLVGGSGEDGGELTVPTTADDSNSAAIKPDKTVVQAPEPFDKNAITEIEVKPAEPVELAAPADPQDSPSGNGPEGDPQSPTPPTEVTVSFINLPEGAKIEINGKPVDIPLVASTSEIPVKVSVSAPGYEPYETQLLFNENKEVPIDMVKKSPPKSVKKSKPARKKKKSKKRRSSKKKKTKTLVSNPFKN